MRTQKEGISWVRDGERSSILPPAFGIHLPNRPRGRHLLYYRRDIELLLDQTILQCSEWQKTNASSLKYHHFICPPTLPINQVSRGAYLFMDGSDLITAKAGDMVPSWITYLSLLSPYLIFPYFPGGRELLFHLPGPSPLPKYPARELPSPLALSNGEGRTTGPIYILNRSTLNHRQMYVG